MSSTSALDSVMDQAAAAAAAAPVDAPASLPSTQTQGNTSVGAPIARPSLDAMADNAGITVDAYLTFKDGGIKIDKGDYFKEFEGLLDVSEVAPIVSARATRGGNTTFIKSYDGVSTAQGENFQQKLMHLQATNDKVDGPYNTVEIPITLGAKVPGADKGARVGITPAITGVKFWNEFYKELREKGLTQATVKIKVRHKYMTNKNGNEWGVATFELLGEA
jgi:hypothetical protein